MTSSSSQRGSIFFYILLGVALFAALGYAIATSMRGNSGVTNERYKLTASEIIDTGSRLAEAAARLRIKGVARDAISFENTVDTNYTNPKCTTENCKIFSSDGGGLSWELPPPGVTIAPWFYTGEFAIDGVGIGVEKGDLVAFLPVIPLDVCEEINKLLGIPSPVPNISGNYSANWFSGTYVDNAITNTVVKGKKAGCVQLGSITGSVLGGATINDSYNYYQVLVAN